MPRVQILGEEIMVGLEAEPKFAGLSGQAECKVKCC